MDHGPGDTDPLLLATGEDGGAQAFLSAQTDQIERSAHAPAHLAATISGGDERERDVVEHASFSKQPVILKHDAEMTSIHWNVTWPDAREIVAADHDPPARAPVPSV